MTDKEKLDAVRAEIHRLVDIRGYDKEMANDLFDFMDSLEVEEQKYKPIDEDFERDAVNFCLDNGLNTTPRIAKTIARHFFELGIKNT